MATVPVLAQAVVRAEERFVQAKDHLESLQTRRLGLTEQITAAQAAKDTAQSRLTTARQALKAAL